MTLAAAVLLGFFSAEVSVYSWHRWISHAGLLRRVANDAFRRRHFHHHFQQYPPEALRADAYVASRDVTFGIVEVLLLVAAAAVIVTDSVRLPVMIAIVAGITLHGSLALTIHSLCHASDDAARQWSLLRLPIVSRVFIGLRRFHDGHHTDRGNYSLLVPAIDILGGTTVRQVVNASIAANELFPGFGAKPSAPALNHFSDTEP